MVDKKKFIAYLDSQEFGRSSGKCARHVRKALQAAGIDTSNHPMDAKDYGPYLEQWGFQPIAETGTPDIGDIAVIQPKPKSRLDSLGVEGHITVYDGFNWVSDFQQNDVWGGGYRKDTPPIQYYWNK